MRVAIVTLGRLGDQLITLPIAHHEYLRGNHVTMVVDEKYTELLDGVSYCDRMVWSGGYNRPLDAAKWAEDTRKFDQILIAQAYGTSHERLTSSFADEMWRLCGYGDYIGRLPLIFDRRNKDREAELLMKVGNRDGKPKVLVSTSGLSSPFQQRDRLLKVIKPLSDRFDFIDLDGFRADRFYDLLGLYEKAVALIATDSGPLHLANATPQLDVLALITHSPDSWHGSPPKQNHKLRLRYNEFDTRCGEIYEWLRANAGVVLNSDILPKIYHVWNKYSPRKHDAEKRHRVAVASWESEYGTEHWRRWPVDTKELPRSGRAVGAHKDVPYVNDLLDHAADRMLGRDIICLTNDDTIFVRGLTDIILKEDKPFWSSRFEHQSVRGPLDGASIRSNAYKHVGADIFVFTASWWLEHRSKLPSFLLSYEAWDLCLRTLIEKTGGRQLEGLVAHIIHAPEWHSVQYRESAGNLFNRESARQFFRQQNMQWPSV